jgi:misacylated tRNA(Ala) deacylase
MSIESDYHRIRSPVLRDWISGNEKASEISTPVGILACQRDPLLRQLDATVIASVVSAPPAPVKGKNAKKAVLAPTIPQDAVCLEVLLNDTVIFPEGGVSFTFGSLPELNSGRYRRPAFRYWDNYDSRW